MLAEHIRGQHLARALLGVEEMGQGISQMEHRPSYADPSVPCTPLKSCHSSRVRTALRTDSHLPLMIVYFLLRICAWIGSLCFAFTITSLGIRPVSLEVGWTRPEGRSEEWDGVGMAVCEDRDRASGNACGAMSNRSR